MLHMVVEVVLSWLVAFGLQRERVEDRRIQGLVIDDDTVVPWGVLVRLSGVSLSSEICEVSAAEAGSFVSGPVESGMVALRKFEGRHRVSVSLRYDMTDVSEEEFRRVFPSLTKLSAELHHGYKTYGIAYLTAWEERHVTQLLKEAAA